MTQNNDEKVKIEKLIEEFKKNNPDGNTKISAVGEALRQEFMTISKNKASEKEIKEFIEEFKKNITDKNDKLKKENKAPLTSEITNEIKKNDEILELLNSPDFLKNVKKIHKEKVDAKIIDTEKVYNAGEWVIVKQKTDGDWADLTQLDPNNILYIDDILFGDYIKEDIGKYTTKGLIINSDEFKKLKNDYDGKWYLVKKFSKEKNFKDSKDKKSKDSKDKKGGSFIIMIEGRYGDKSKSNTSENVTAKDDIKIIEKNAKEVNKLIKDIIPKLGGSKENNFKDETKKVDDLIKEIIEILNSSKGSN
jgi:hypothetical protein